MNKNFPLPMSSEFPTLISVIARCALKTEVKSKSPPVSLEHLMRTNQARKTTKLENQLKPYIVY